MCIFSLIDQIWDNKYYHPSVWIDGICNTGTGILGILLKYHPLSINISNIVKSYQIIGGLMVQRLSNVSQTNQRLFLPQKKLYVYYNILYYIFKIWYDTYILSFFFTYVILISDTILYDIILLYKTVYSNWLKDSRKPLPTEAKPSLKVCFWWLTISNVTLLCSQCFFLEIKHALSCLLQNNLRCGEMLYEIEKQRHHS